MAHEFAVINNEDQSVSSIIFRQVTKQNVKK
jgi:hypothetical protein